MADKIIINKEKVTSLFNKIRTKAGVTGSKTFDEMGSVVDNIKTGITPAGSLEITENGEYDVTNYAKVVINIASTPAGYDVEITNSGAGSWGNSINITYTDATGTHTKSSSGETLTGVTYLKVNNINYAGYDGTLTCNEYTETELKAGVTLTKNVSIDIFSSCFVEGTLITMADGTTKAVELIENGDEVLSWDFDKGEMSTGKVFWVAEPKISPIYWNINLSDGTNLKLVGAKGKAHRLFSVNHNKFMYPQDFKGSVFKEDLSRPIIEKVERVVDNVKYYNFANTNLNCFANGIMAGSRFSNVYPINNMKFIKDNRTLTPIKEFDGIPAKYIEGLRLQEQIYNANESVNYYATMKEHILHNYIEHEKGYTGPKDYKKWLFK